MTTTVLADRVAVLPGPHLDKGAHATFDQGHCAMEVAAWLAGEGHGDRPRCVCPVLGAYVRYLNDNWDDRQRQRLLAYLPRMVGTAGDGQEEARCRLALDWLIHTYTPAWLDAAGLGEQATALRNLPPITDPATTGDAARVVRDVQDQAEAARSAARPPAWSASWYAAAVAAASDAGGYAAAYAIEAAGHPDWDTAGDALTAAEMVAEIAAESTPAPVVDRLQGSALDLFDRMINPSAVTA